jgi:lysozyme
MSPIHWPIDERAVAIIQKYESLHDGDLVEIGLQPKMDPVGIWTGGWGRALRDPETGAFLCGEAHRRDAYRLCHGLDEAKAEKWLVEDLAEVIDDVTAVLKVSLSEPEFGALVSFTYNVGIGNLKGSTLLRLLNQEKLRPAADELPKWVRAGGRVMRGLVSRRAAERALFLAAR